MSIVFNIGDTDFDDFNDHDEEFLDEAFNFNFNKESRNNSVRGVLRNTTNNGTCEPPITRPNFLRTSAVSSLKFRACTSKVNESRNFSNIVQNSVEKRARDCSGKAGSGPPLKKHNWVSDVLNETFEPHIENEIFVEGIFSNKKRLAVTGTAESMKNDEIRKSFISHPVSDRSNDFSLNPADSNRLSLTPSPAPHGLPNTSCLNSFFNTLRCIPEGQRHTQNTSSDVFLPHLVREKRGSNLTIRSMTSTGNFSPMSNGATFSTGNPKVSTSNHNDNSLVRRTPSRLCKDTNNESNLSNRSTFTPRRNVSEGPCRAATPRRFPGPAGVLPKLDSCENLDDLGSKSAISQRPNRKSLRLAELVSLEGEEDFKTKPWTLMQERVREDFPHVSDSISSIVTKAASRRLERGKVMFLAALVKTFRPNGFDSSVILRDPSGEIGGTLHRKVLEAENVELGPGCGLFLKQVSVFSPSPRKHYLNITPGNILEIFPCNAKQSCTEKVKPATIVEKEPEDLNGCGEAVCSSSRVDSEVTQSGENIDDLLHALDDDDNDMILEALNYR